jgi:hypothetical protein
MSKYGIGDIVKYKWNDTEKYGEVIEHDIHISLYEGEHIMVYGGGVISVQDVIEKVINVTETEQYKALSKWQDEVSGLLRKLAELADHDVIREELVPAQPKTSEQMKVADIAELVYTMHRVSDAASYCQQLRDQLAIELYKQGKKLGDAINQANIAVQRLKEELI